ncbi:MAG: TetR/AcrR family transcriptional regulator [Rubricoccaceae bacterium]
MSARRGRPPAFDREEVLNRLLFLFWEKGYDGTSQSDMIERAGISSSTLYNAFGNKADVFEAVAQRYNQMSWANMTPLREGTHGLADVAAFLQGIADFTRGEQAPPGCLMVRTMTELGGRPNAPDSAEAQTCTYRDQIVESLELALRRAVEAGEIEPDEVDSKAQLVLTLMLGAMAVGVSNREAGAAMIDTGREMVASWR